jgi:hypothetical protein
MMVIPQIFPVQPTPSRLNLDQSDLQVRTIRHQKILDDNQPSETTISEGTKLSERPCISMSLISCVFPSFPAKEKKRHFRHDTLFSPLLHGLDKGKQPRAAN